MRSKQESYVGTEFWPLFKTVLPKRLCDICQASESQFNQRNLPYIREHSETVYTGLGITVRVREVAEEVIDSDGENGGSKQHSSKGKTGGRKSGANKKKKDESPVSTEGDAKEASGSGGEVKPPKHKRLQLDDPPPWYQELSNQQQMLAECLDGAMKADAEENHAQRTRRLLGHMGVRPPPSSSQILGAMGNSALIPILFLLYLFKEIRNPDQNARGRYSVNEKIILSALTHLVMPRTLLELDIMLPSPPPCGKKKTKSSSPKENKTYSSPYEEPFPRGRPWKPKNKDIYTHKDIEKLHVGNPSVATSNAGSAVGTAISFRDPKSTFFKDQEPQRSCESGYPISSHHSSGVTKVVAVNSQSTFKSKRDIHMYFDHIKPRIVTSTEPPNFPHERKYQAQTGTDYKRATEEEEVEPPGEAPMTRQKIASMTEEALAKKPSLALPAPICTLPTIRLAATDYWKALPRVPEHRPKRPRKCTNEEPAAMLLENVKSLLRDLAAFGNPVAALPDAHSLPHITKWLLARSGFFLSDKDKEKLASRSKMKQETLYTKYTKVDPPQMFLSPKQLHEITWSSMNWFRTKCDGVVSDYYARVRQARVKDAAKFWPTMCTKYHDNIEFRNVYFSYLPAKESDVFPVNPIQL